ncbi:protein HOTHEAD-like [Mercurialis annua]|uniref:protein HOTHEAD-like n=1 Tax=Mercurialis annua TaxID=3986 RepID=UPI00215F220E|nr:protein HOTHEAD-like [Mercurialis annua]
MLSTKAVFVEEKLEMQKMGCFYLTAFLFVLVNLSESSPLIMMTSDVNEVSGKSFDYIVVGGGTAGCSLAATLSEKFSVLLIERGGSPYDIPLLLHKRYFFFPALQIGDRFSSVAQSFVSRDGVPNIRGHVLGGTSVINAGFYSRATDDYVHRVGWDEQLVKQAYEWAESKIAFKLPELAPWQSVFKFGLLEAGVLPFNGFSLEHIEGTKIGATIYDEYGIRHPSSDLLVAGNPKNIMILLNATVKSIIFDGTDNERTARGIRFIKSGSKTDQIYEAYINQRHESSSRGDVILCAGALGSPQILMLSGIGPKKHLQNFNIPLVLHLKGVGRLMQDNPAIFFRGENKTNYRPTEPPQVVGIAEDFKFIVEGIIEPRGFNAAGTLLAIKLAIPQSTGWLKLNNTDPRQNPIVKFNYFSKEKDLENCAKMVQLLRKVSRSKSVVTFLRNELQNNLTGSMSSDSPRNFCKNNVMTFYHYHGGCTVGSVVDKDYKVYGVKNLRVVDGSTFLETPGTNPMATLLMLGRYQGSKILRGREKEFSN